MRLTINVSSLDAFARGMREAPRYTQRVLEATMHMATLLLQRETQENIPRGATGLTAASVQSDVHSTAAGVLGVVGSAKPEALFVELGTKAHMPPVKALKPWVKAVLGITDEEENERVAFLVARKIAAHGTKAQRPFERAALSTQSQILAMFERAAWQVANHLDGETT